MASRVGTVKSATRDLFVAPDAVADRYCPSFSTPLPQPQLSTMRCRRQQARPPGGGTSQSIPCPNSSTGSSTGTSATRCCSPIVINPTSSGFDFTSAKNGVKFDFFGNGHPIQMAWIAPGSTAGFLVLPRNGKVTNGEELFGNITPQPRSANPNGFLALANLNALTGGRDRSVIDSNDPIYYKLRLWQFTNDNGKVVGGKLSTLPQLGIKAIYLNYSTTTKTDQYGNQFRYVARVVSTNPHASKYAYDMFFSALGASGAQQGSNSGLRLPSGIALLAIGLLLAIQPIRRRRTRLVSAPADDMQPASSAPHSDLISKS
jgi:hypothetical protein